MKFTDIFIHKPVLATVVSLFILFLGIRSATELSVRQYPLIENAIVSVSTSYPGADAELVKGFITTPLEQEVASAKGIEYITSTSSPGFSNITVKVSSDADPDEVVTQIVSRVNRVRNELPEEAQDPVLVLQVGEQIASMYISFFSDTLPINRISDYVTREVEPLLTTVPGVESARLDRSNSFAMRIWLDPERMAALNMTASDIAAALRSNNVLSAVGSTKGSMIQVNLKANTDISTVEGFRNLVLREKDGAIVRLADVASVELGSENYQSSGVFSGREAVYVPVKVLPDANTLEVVAAVREVWKNQIHGHLPEGLQTEIPYDATIYIDNAIEEVQKTIAEAVVIVIVVIFLFLGSLRSVLIPTIAVPLSLVGALFLMWLMGFTINLLTLLAVVLAIGIVVDDAIIVLENIHRHIEEGMSPQDAALRGARELAWPIVAMTTTLVAVYLPIGFVGGLTGTLFTEFAFTLAGAVLLSGIVALTLSPMMCSKMLKAEKSGGRLEHWLDARFERLRHIYQRDLDKVMEDRFGILIFGGIILASCYFLFINSPSELAPQEDIGMIFYMGETDPYTTLEYVEGFSVELSQIANDVPEIENNFLYNGMSPTSTALSNGLFGGFVFRPWSERERTTPEVLAEDLQPRVQQIAGVDMALFNPPALPTAGSGFPIEFVIKSTADFESLNQLGDEILQKAMASGRFIFLNKDMQIDQPRERILIDRDKAALLGVDMRTLSNDLSALLSGGYVNRFSLDNRSYKVIPQVARTERLNPDALYNYYTRTKSGDVIPLSTLVKLESDVIPRSLRSFQQLNSVTLSGVPRPGVSLGDALGELERVAGNVLPQEYSVDYGGQSRQYKTEGSVLIITFFLALILIYLVLSAQFESFRDPLIMLVTVPMSVSGALLCLNVLALFQVNGATLNIYTQVGLVTLIGVISKHGILIVEFANRLQKEGHDKRTAISEAASIRLRPVLMTTAALVLAMVPLLLSSGPGAAARFSMGLVISSGMTIGTLFTLYVLPAVYLLLGRDYGAVDHQGEGVLTG